MSVSSLSARFDVPSLLPPKLLRLAALWSLSLSLCSSCGWESPRGKPSPASAISSSPTAVVPPSGPAPPKGARISAMRERCADGRMQACEKLLSACRVERPPPPCVELHIDRTADLEQPSLETVALGLWTKACFYGDVIAACRRAGLAHLEGMGAKADRPNSVFFLRRACALGDPVGCKRLAKLGYAPIGGSRPGRAACAAFGNDCEKRCEEGHRFSCFRFGARGGGFRYAVYPDPIVVALRKGCEGGAAESCYRLAHEMHAEELRDKLMKRACDGGYPQACATIGWGRMDLLERACWAGECDELARELEAKDPVRARMLRRRSCLFRSYCKPYRRPAPSPKGPASPP